MHMNKDIKSFLISLGMATAIGGAYIASRFSSMTSKARKSIRPKQLPQSHKEAAKRLKLNKNNIELA